MNKDKKHQCQDTSKQSTCKRIVHQFKPVFWQLKKNYHIAAVLRALTIYVLVEIRAKKIPIGLFRSYLEG